MQTDKAHEDGRDGAAGKMDDVVDLREDHAVAHHHDQTSSAISVSFWTL